MFDKQKITEINDAVIKTKQKANMNARGRIDIGKMARQLGFVLLSTAALPSDIIGVMYLNLTGRFSQDLGSKKMIALNKAFDTLHQRFAIAHEIGHYVMHETNRIDADWEHAYAMTQDDEEGIEGEANRFAAILLMEKRSFIDEFEKLSKNPDNETSDIIESLSLKFGAPQSAVRRRIDELELKNA